MKRRLPGMLTPQERIKQMLRVDQAGEYGAIRIYKGQLDVLKNHPTSSLIQEMKLQEQEHLDSFNQLLLARNIKPTIFTPLWHVGGYLLGALTAKLGAKAAMACTVAVEEVIDHHYAGQIEELQQSELEPELTNIIKRFQADEIAHKDQGLEAGAADAPGFAVLRTSIKAITRAAIWLSTRA
ncbi:MAG: demethoxyubiquinone hydroxylase family protein [Caedibacter sp. 37-49]|nr:MAG: demethoxyubiquinone hydroxylase family protein [Caedibacter sp. 37-49]